jgi:tetratricopeptide (TPR) repeat protein
MMPPLNNLSAFISGMLPGSSARLKVGRGFPAAPRAFADVRTVRGLASPSGAVGTPRPTFADFRLWILDLRLAATALPLLLALAALGATPSAPPPEQAPPSTPREFYNAGARQLGAGKLREAEASLESALASQNQQLQPPALYNLGLVRFGQGVEQLKKGPAAKPTADRAKAIAQQADAALRQAEEALAGNDVQKMVAAYLRGRGTRRELKAATQAVRRALQVHGAALTRWERALGDFKSTFELDKADSDARHNSDVLNRLIAKLVDSLHDLQQSANGMGNKNEQLGEALKELKGRIPAPDMPPGAAGDDEEEDEQPLGPKPGEEEGPTKEGKEMTLSPEQAGWLLEAYRLDSERRLPMGQGPPADPKDRPRRPW